jgi:hypothetical protein
MLEALQRIKLHFYCCSIGGDWIFIFENDFGNFNIKPTITFLDLLYTEMSLT